MEKNDWSKVKNTELVQIYQKNTIITNFLHFFCCYFSISSEDGALAVNRNGLLTWDGRQPRLPRLGSLPAPGGAAADSCRPAHPPPPPSHHPHLNKKTKLSGEKIWIKLFKFSPTLTYLKITKQELVRDHAGFLLLVWEIPGGNVGDKEC